MVEARRLRDEALQHHGVVRVRPFAHQLSLRHVAGTADERMDGPERPRDAEELRRGDDVLRPLDITGREADDTPAARRLR